jgi:hypothetical protein
MSIPKAKEQWGISMKYSVREAVARSYVGWDFVQADRVIAWLDQCGYVIVSKASLAQRGDTEERR